VATSYPPKVAATRALLLELVGAMSEGEALPAERDLAERWGVSRMTLRRAMDDLVVDGILERRRGAGTFLTRPRLSRRLAMTSFTEDMVRRGKVPSTRTLEFRHRKADRAIAQRLRVPIGEPVIAFVRLRLADGQPMAIESSHIQESLVPGLTAEDLEQSWYGVLADRYGIHIESATFNVEPILPDARIASWLGVPTTQPCLRLKIESFDGRGRVVEMGSATFRGDTYNLSVELSAPTRGETTQPRTAQRSTHKESA
jgi:GntR family transcriptional regulator